ncbi:MAG: hypothetical protein HQM09_00250 [Candidatus Riflebacteria bacterium]|nr:hypothetical protein [Candidatus Riflebacteria bacterium]
MKLGEETWKWSLVIILLAVFILVGNQAWRSFNNPDDQFEPPEDYLKGDSFDQEHRDHGPGAGQPVEVPESTTGSGAAHVSGQPDQQNGPDIPVEHPATSAWDQIKDPAKP